VIMLAGRPRFSSPGSIRLLLVIQLALAAATVALSLLAVLVPSLVPSLPHARSTSAYLVMAVGLFFYASLAIRAARTFLLTRRVADLAVIVGLIFLGAAVYAALALSYMQLGWWLGHAFELAGILLVGSSVAYDLRRGRQSRSLIGDLTASEIVAAEEAFLGARVRALMVRLAEKDVSTEEHTRRVAKLAVALGEELGLPANRLRSLAIGGLLHDIGKLSVPSAILQKPAALDADEFAAIKLHPERGSDLLAELGGFDAGVARLVLDHHERLDGGGYPRGRGEANLNLETRILSVCDVFDALVSPRVYRDAWPVERALELLRAEAGTAFDPVCVQALVRVLGHEAGGGELAAAA
jgi:HD-GYP domain-containing protein (c-di-GMP phosphodiesterase class II)